jgi:hypothetical protein
LASTIIIGIDHCKEQREAPEEEATNAQRAIASLEAENTSFPIDLDLVEVKNVLDQKRVGELQQAKRSNAHNRDRR